ncbi:hypothetical protein VKT23_020443 [Stygiomarasmius scandens]|uniref:Uncharacterized protein n=1 Tax=Marasmiellus scandens TaxID=2682957 RepID=A0ABR1ILI0_9AGAR
MVLNVRLIHTNPQKDLNIVVRNHRDSKMAFLSPNNAEHIDFEGWLDTSTKCTEMNVTRMDGRSAVIQLEDDNEWGLVVSGSIQEGRKRIAVGGSRDFDVRFTRDGHMRLECRGGYNFGPGSGKILDFVLVPFQVI